MHVSKRKQPDFRDQPRLQTCY